MKSRLSQVVQKRQALVERSAAQRDALGVHLAGLRPITRIGAAAMGIGRVLRQHPALTSVAALTLVGGLVRRRRLLVWAGRVLTLRGLYRAFREQQGRGRSR